MGQGAGEGSSRAAAVTGVRASEQAISRVLDVVEFVELLRSGGCRIKNAFVGVESGCNESMNESCSAREEEE